MTYIILIPLIIMSLSPYAPQPGDTRLVTESVIIAEYNDYHVIGYKRTPCHQIRIAGDDVYSVIDPELYCMQTITPFEVIFR